MGTKSKRHTHKYHKVNLSSGQVWACGLPNCNHHMPNHMIELVPGKASICWNCDETMILDPINMADDRPVCSVCRNPALIELFNKESA